MKITDIKLPEGFEAKFEGKTLVVTKAEEKLDTWEKCVCYLENFEYITQDSIIETAFRSKDLEIDDSDYNLVPENCGKGLLAFMQLLVCRNAWYKKYKCNIYGNTPIIYCISHDKQGNLRLYQGDTIRPVLSFNSSEIRDRFYNTFYNLIVKAKCLI